MAYSNTAGIDKAELGLKLIVVSRFANSFNL